MQSRTPRLGWIAQVLADPETPRPRAGRPPLRLVAGGTAASGGSDGKPPAQVPAVRRPGGPSGPKAGR
jgi:hypothetical protein